MDSSQHTTAAALGAQERRLLGRAPGRRICYPRGAACHSLQLYRRRRGETEATGATTSGVGAASERARPRAQSRGRPWAPHDQQVQVEAYAWAWAAVAAAAVSEARGSCGHTTAQSVHRWPQQRARHPSSIVVDEHQGVHQPSPGTHAIEGHNHTSCVCHLHATKSTHTYRLAVHTSGW